MKELARVEKRALREKVKRLTAYLKARELVQDYYDFDNEQAH